MIILSKITPIITALLVVSVCINVFFLAVYVPSDQDRLSRLDVQLNALSTENTQLHNVSGAGDTGSASLQAPAVSQSVQTPA